MKSPNEVKLEILEEFKREYRKAYKDIFDESILSQGNPWFEDFLSQSLDRLEASIVERIISELKDSLERGYELKTTVEALEARMIVEDLLNPNKKE